VRRVRTGRTRRFRRRAAVRSKRYRGGTAACTGPAKYAQPSQPAGWTYTGVRHLPKTRRQQTRTRPRRAITLTQIRTFRGRPSLNVRLRALVDAVAGKYIDSNPASNIKPRRRPRTRRDVWTPDQIQIFLKSVQQDRFAALFLLELTTGIRRGQLCGLKWPAVDLQAGDITVHDNRVVVGGQARDKAGGKTKNADQTISIDRVTTAALQAVARGPEPRT
jgi:integrase